MHKYLHWSDKARLQTLGSWAGLGGLYWSMMHVVPVLQSYCTFTVLEYDSKRTFSLRMRWTHCIAVPGIVLEYQVLVPVLNLKTSSTVGCTTGRSE